jgi:SpoVK/Ycf46/Vps4 family AAA+-type ATPase
MTAIQTFERAEPASGARHPVGEASRLIVALRRLDVLLGEASERFLAAHDGSMDEDRILSVTPEELAGSLAREPGLSSLRIDETPHEPLVRPEDGSRLAALETAFRLEPIDLDILLLALAPEIDRRYGRAYSFLQDDATRPKPSVDLVLELFCANLEDKLTMRRRLEPGSPLLLNRLLRLVPDEVDPESSGLRASIRIEPRVVRHLLGGDAPDPRLNSYLRVHEGEDLDDLSLPIKVRSTLEREGRRIGPGKPSTVLYLHGPDPAGKLAIASAVAHGRGQSILAVNGERLLSDEGSGFEEAAALVLREAALGNYVLYWDGLDALRADDRRRQREDLWRALYSRQGLTVLAGLEPWETSERPANVEVLAFEVPLPGRADRLRLWEKALSRKGPPLDPSLTFDWLADAYRLGVGQIRDAAEASQALARQRSSADGRVCRSDIAKACRMRPGHGLNGLARRITPHASWEDLVLPTECIRPLREFCDRVVQRTLVLEVWGFGRKQSLGHGLHALLTGPSGTGKTMAAEVIAGRLELELWKVNPAAVVSKYIGETEKNLSKVFDGAEASNAVLFFDEADALLGKRGEVRDAHDRFANMEVSYLLQRMEEYSGVVIVATNLRKNIDEAFLRRLSAVIEFPLPATAERRKIWERVWPDNIPRDPELDLDFMAGNCEVTGGAIRNIAIGAAFLAASEGRAVGMDHLVRATCREYGKMGKVFSASEFGRYAGLATYPR